MNNLINIPRHNQAELLREATENVINEERAEGYHDKVTDMYKDKSVCEEYERYLDSIGE